MSSGNVSEKNLTIDLKSDFKEMIAHLMSLSCQEKIKKQKNIALNKDKKSRKNSANRLSESENEMEEENDSIFAEKQAEEENQGELCFNANLATTQNQNKFLVNLQILDRPRGSVECERYFIDERTSEKAQSFMNLVP